MCNCMFKSSIFMEWINNILDNRSLWVIVQDYKFIMYIFLFDFEEKLGVNSGVIGNFDFTPLQNKSS